MKKTRNILTTELSDAELLDLINSNSLTPSKTTYISPYLSFISKYNLCHGSSKVPSKAIYELFRLDHPDITHVKFLANLKKYLPFDINLSRITLFLLNKDVLDIGKSVQEIILKKKQPTARKVRNQKKHIEAFLEYFKLRPGNNSISLHVFLDIYDNYCYRYKKKQLNEREFRHLLTVYLPEVHIRKIRHFKVHDDFFKVVKLETVKTITRRYKTKGISEKKIKKITN